MSLSMKKASRKRAKMRIGIFGPSGSGKTISALRLAKGLVGEWDKIVVIDTENKSADLYSHLGGYYTLSLEAPFSPQKFIEAIIFCQKQPGIECIVVDSISHEWEGPGGIMDIHEKLGDKVDGYFKKTTPMHRDFINSITTCSLHIISTGRSKTDYNFEQKTLGGKGKIEKIGTKICTKEGFDYEMTLAFQLNADHLASVDKDRTDLYKDAIPFLITEEIGEKIRDWNNSGEEIKVDPCVSLRQMLIDKLSSKTDKFTNKEVLGELMGRIGFTNSKEILICSDENVLLDCLAALD